MQLPDVFIVTLMRDKDRVEHVQDVLIPSLQVAEFPRIHVQEAVDGKSSALRESLVAERMVVEEKYGKQCRVGQLGCYMSHYAVWKRALAEGLEHCVVLEDDAVFATDKEHINNVLQEAQHFDFVYLYTSSGQWKNDKRVQLPFYAHLNSAYRQYGTVAYYVTRKGMETLVDECRTMTCNVDETIMKLVTNRLHAASCKIVPFRTVGQVTAAYRNEQFRSTVHGSNNASAVVREARQVMTTTEVESTTSGFPA